MLTQALAREKVGGWITDITGDREGNIWFTTVGNGVWRYDGKNRFHFNTENGLPYHTSFQVAATQKGEVWIGMNKGGLCRYDGQKIETFTVSDGLIGENVGGTIIEDREGHLWFGVGNGGVHRFDGRNFQVFTVDDDLLHNTVIDIFEDKNGSFIFVTVGGITIYQPPKEKIPPQVRVDEIIADKVYPNPIDLTVSSALPRITFAYHGTSFKTKRMRYNYVLEGHNTEWQKTWKEEAIYEKLRPGQYTFKVIAINRDLVYSQTPAIVNLTVVLPWYQNGWVLYPSAGGIVALALFASVFAYRYYQERQQVLAYQRQAVEELADARRVQMGLMPEVAPEVKGLEIAGKCVSANTVSGDFFDYLQANEQVAIVVGDVTGHGMQGAMNAVMVDGILHSVAQAYQTLSAAKLLAAINDALGGRMEDQMNVTMVIGHIKPEMKTLTLANAGHHAHPLLVRSGTIEPLIAKGMPLGMMAGISYREMAFELQSGDVVVFMTDGIIEAKDRNGMEYQSSGRLEHVLAQFTADTSAEAMVTALIDDATAFGADMTTEEEDDITVVVDS